MTLVTNVPGLVGLLLASLACGDTPPPRAPEAPEGTASEQLGAPYDTHYAADIEATRGRVRVIVREESVCDVIPVSSVVETGKKKFILEPLHIDYPRKHGEP